MRKQVDYFADLEIALENSGHRNSSMHDHDLNSILCYASAKNADDFTCLEKILDVVAEENKKYS
jgi:hypothetical protein